jgi:ribosomal protein S19
MQKQKDCLHATQYLEANFSVVASFDAIASASLQRTKSVVKLVGRLSCVRSETVGYSFELFTGREYEICFSHWY